MYQEIKALQNNILKLLNKSSQKTEEHIFNIDSSTFFQRNNKNKTEEKLALYKSFLDFFQKSLINFQSSSVDQVFGEYSFGQYNRKINLIDEKLFKEKVEKYRAYANVKNIRSILKSLNNPIVTNDIEPCLSFTELQTYNREHYFKQSMIDTYYNEKNPQHILKIFEKRIIQMENCVRENQTRVGIIKAQTELIYYSIEARRERIMVEAIKKKLETITEHEQKKNTLFKELQKMTTYIFWGLKDFHCYYNEDGSLKSPEQLNDYVTRMLADLRKAKKKDPNCVKKMMTFLPLNLFKKENMIYDFDEGEIRKFFLENGILRDYETGNPSSEDQNGIINGLVTQFRLGIGYDLFQDITRESYSKIPSLWNIYSIILDLFNSCGRYANYNIYLNLLQIYMFLINSKSVFPSSFSLRKEIRPGGINASILNQDTESYEFRYKDPINKNNLFNENMKLLGVIFIKYLSDDNTTINVLPLFVFKNIKFAERKQKLRIDTTETTRGNDFISSYNGVEQEIIICDQKMFFIEDGEITPSMSLTYHELTNLLYYGAKTYMFKDGNDKTELYFTYRKRGDKELERLISDLNMIEVFFLKGKIIDSSRQRFKIMTREEIITFLQENPEFQLMAHQKVSHSLADNISLSLPSNRLQIHNSSRRLSSASLTSRHLSSLLGLNPEKRPTSSLLNINTDRRELIGGNKNSNKQRKTRKNKKTRKQRKNTFKKKSVF